MTIIRTKDVPYLAGSSNDNRDVFIDRRVPHRIKVRRANGKGFKSIDPAVPLSIHERSEHRAMKRGKSYEQAHIENGTADERAWVEKQGLDWKHYEEIMDGLLSHIEHEHPTAPPKDLYLKPYPHDKQELLRRAAKQPVKRADGGAVFGTLSPQEEAERPPNVLDKIVSGLGNAAANIVKFPRQYMDAYQPGQMVADTPQATQWAPETALALAGGAAPAAERGAAGIFGGRLAKNADTQALDLAQHMEARGMPREQIWEATGWFKGPDKQWKFEIPDTGLSVAHGEGRGFTGPISHPELEAAYPGLKRIDMSVGPGDGTGRYIPEQARVEVNSSSPREAREIAAHELQHAVQQIENFGHGGNPHAMLNLAERAYGPGWAVPETMQQKMVDAANEAYRRMAGEVEARTTQRSVDMTPAQRRANPPWERQDVPDELQIVRTRASGGAVKMADGGDPGDWVAPGTQAGNSQADDWVAPATPSAPPKKPFTLSDTWPARLAKSVWSAVTLPGDVMKGNVQLPSREGVPGSAPEESGQVTYEPNALASWALPEGTKWQAPGAESPFGRAVELSTMASPISAGSAMKRGLPATPSAGETIAGEFASQFKPGAIKEGTASSEFGIPLSTGEAAKDFNQIQFERTALAGGYGEAAQREAQKFFDARRVATEAATNKQTAQLDPYGQVITGGPVETGDLVGESLRNAAAAAKNAYQQRYNEFADLPGVIHAAGLEGIGQKIKGSLSLRENPVVIDDVTTPAASRALKDIEQNIDRLKIQNKADPFGPPNPETIVGVNLKGIDQTRKRLVQFQQAAMQSPTDRRAVGAVIDAFDQHVENAIADGLFSGSDRALAALKEARAGFADYQRTFKPRKNDGGVGAVIDKIVNRDDGAGATAGEIANFMFGAAGTGANGLSVRVSNRLKSVLGESSPEWSAIRQGMWQRLTGPADGLDKWGPQKVSQRLFQFVNGSGKPLAEVLYTPQERMQMLRFANALKEQVPPVGAVNTSYTAPVLSRILGATADRIFGHIPGVSFLMRIGRDQIDAARQAGRVTQSLYGEPAKVVREPGPVKSRLGYAGTTGYMLSPGVAYPSNRSE